MLGARLSPLLLAAALLAGPAAAADAPMSAEAFERYAEGKTLYYGDQGFAYGVEEYLEDRRVRWSFLDGQCKDGRWYESGSQICFVYEDDPTPQCWTFFDSPGGLLARFENEAGVRELYEAHQSDEPMLCLGPEVGV